VGQASDSRPDPFDARAGPGHPIGWLVPYWDDPAGPAPKSVSIASSLSSHHICWRKCTEQAWYATSTLLIFLVMLRIRDDIFLANIPASEASTAGQDQAHLVGCFSSPARLIFAHGLTIEFHVPPASRPSVFATWSCLGAPDQCALPPPDLDSARSCLISNFGGALCQANVSPRLQVHAGSLCRAAPQPLPLVPIAIRLVELSVQHWH
jgi:hypothetical protein